MRPFLSAEQFQNVYSNSGSGSKLIGVSVAAARRAAGLFSAGKFDLLFVQREAMPFGPGVFEWLYQTVGRVPMVLDLDDATYVRYVSPTYGRLGSLLKFFGKTDNLIDRAELVVCGNRFISQYVERRGTHSIIIPTIVDTEVFKPSEKGREVPVIGWLGTHSTFPFLEQIFPILRKLAEKHRFKLKVVGAGRKELRIDGVELQNEKWSLEREVEDFQDLDIGLYPISVSKSASDAWLAGKSGFKAVQYMAVGVPFIMSPIGVCAELGVHEETHFNADNDEDWYSYLDRLLSNPDLRLKMGIKARRYALEHYGLAKHAEILADALKSVVLNSQS